MTDDEIFIYAAKAADQYSDKEPLEHLRNRWNPWCNWKDTYELMVQLNLSVICDNDGRKLMVFAGIAPVWSQESRLQDPKVATARAIMHAAAQIGLKKYG